MAVKDVKTENEKKMDSIRLAAEADLETFIKLVRPQQVVGSIHSELCRWWTRSKAKKHQLVLLPRDHGKSMYCAFRIAWEITRDPTIRVLYISATSKLAEKQLGLIKSVLESKIYRRYWPEMIHPEEGKRSKWTNSEIEVDHPKRKEEGIRDATVFTGGLTTSLTGLHCDIAVLDDVVVQENAYTKEGREKVRSQYSLLSSIEGADAREIVVGTRYHPQDLYQSMIEMQQDIFDEEGNIISTSPVYEVFQREVEDIGDLTGEFLWPRQQRSDGKYFGFNTAIISRKRAQYLDKTQFYAQYYNNPNASDEAGIDRSQFQYYDKTYLSQESGHWTYKGKRLNVIASIDFAYSLREGSDHTAICIAGIDSYRNIYVLDIDRFKTDKMDVYFSHLFEMYKKWQFRKLVAEVTAAQKTIVEELKNSYFQPQGLAISIQEHKPTRHDGPKEERIKALLESPYADMRMWHYRGGNCQILEDELVMRFPPHDDVKDALASCVQYLNPPVMVREREPGSATVLTHPRFGGVLSVG